MVLGPGGTEALMAVHIMVRIYAVQTRLDPLFVLTRPTPGMDGSHEEAGSLVLQFPFLLKLQNAMHHARGCGIPCVVAASGCADMPRQVRQHLNIFEEE